ncbi:MAG: hypothetical protein ACT4N1_00685 [Nitrososphaerota archaeon]
MSQIDSQKPVYLFVHGRIDLEPIAINALVSNGFSKDRIISAKADKVGTVGDYMAMLWFPPNPDHIKIQKITKVEHVTLDDVTGLWKGVSKEDLFEIKLK